MKSAQPVVLDTLSWLYLMEGETSLGGNSVLSAVQTAGEQSNLYISVLCISDVLRLEREGRIRFSISVDDWLDQALASPGLRVVDLDALFSRHIERLPERDGLTYPQAATATLARLLGGFLVTQEQDLEAYALRGYVRLLSSVV